MVTTGSVSRDDAALAFDFLTGNFRGRRNAIRALTHGAPEFVFWIYPDGKLCDARASHRAHPPPGHDDILDDEPDYGGFLRGRVVRHIGCQLIVIYCRSDALASSGIRLKQFLSGLSRMPIPIDGNALVISDNADIYGTVTDLLNRAA